MPVRQRLRKPELERTRPLRSWSTLVTAPGDPAQPRTGGAKARKPRPSSGSPKATTKARAATRSEPAPAPKRSSVAARGVELGYKVVEEYVKQGRKSAAAFNASPLSVTAVSEMQKLTERLFQYASDLGSVWLELLQRVTTEGLAGRAANAAAPPSAAPEAPRPAPGRPRGLALEVTGAKAAEIQLTLVDPHATAPLRVEALRAKGPAGTRLAGLTLQSTSDTITIRLAVAKTQATGVYEGVVVDAAANVPCGSLWVRIAPPK